MTSMVTSIIPSQDSSGRSALTVCVAAMIALAVAMGVGRFAFTPLFPLMVRDGLLVSEDGALLAASNYLGYLIGAVVAARILITPATMVLLGLISTVIVTAAIGWTSSLSAWIVLRFVAGLMSAWTLVGTSAWGLAWLAVMGRPQLAGAIFGGVGLGIAAAGCYCLFTAGLNMPPPSMWVVLGGLAGIATIFPLIAVRLLPAPVTNPGLMTPQRSKQKRSTNTKGLIACYALFGFGYILPATYLPALARQLVDDPQVFGLFWPLFGVAAALSTVAASWLVKEVNRLKLWSVSHFMMAIGVLLPSVAASLTSVSIAALMVGGTFMVITMVAMQEARARAEGNATAVLGQMTAGFAFGQLMGPLASAAFGRFTGDFTNALNFALAVSAAGLLFSAFYLWRQGRLYNSH